jgi:hypothetical protein
MTKIELQDELAHLQRILGGYERGATPFEAGQQSDLDRVFAEDRKTQLLSRIVFLTRRSSGCFPGPQADTRG